MKCSNCMAEFEGTFCPNCGQPATGQQQVQNNQPQAYSQEKYNNTNPGYQQYRIEKCTNCGEDMAVNAKVCGHCGFAKGIGKHYCRNCGEHIEEGAAVCVKCGVPVCSTKSRLITLIFAIVLGGFGLSDFYLGYTKYAIIKFVVSVALCWTVLAPLGMWIWAMISAIMVYNGTIPDANGNELKD